MLVFVRRPKKLSAEEFTKLSGEKSSLNLDADKKAAKKKRDRKRAKIEGSKPTGVEKLARRAGCMPILCLWMCAERCLVFVFM